MRTFLIAVSVFSIWLIFSFYLYGTIEVTSNQLAEHVQSIEKLVKDENWDEANKELDSFKNKWEPVSKMWKLVVPHEGIDEIELALLHTKRFIYGKDKINCLMNLATLQYYLQDIYFREKVNLINIL